MKYVFLAAGAAAVALSAGAAQAATKHHRHAKASTNAGNYAEPAQPVAYSKLDEYLKTSPARRKKEDWSLASAGAATGTAANASATMGASPEPQAGAMYQQSAPASAPDNSGAMGSTTAPPSTEAAPPGGTAPPATGTAPTDQSAAPPAAPPTTGGDTPKP